MNAVGGDPLNDQLPDPADGRATTLTERRRAVTELEIALAAARLFTDRGTAGTTAADIADAAGVAIRTFYRYFPSKEEAVTPLLTAGADAWRASLSAADPAIALDTAIENAIAQALAPPTDDAQGQPTEWTRGLIRAAEQDSALAGVWYRANRTSETLLGPIIAARAGASIGPLEVRLIAAAATDAIRVALEVWALSDAPYSGPDGPGALAVRSYRFLRGGSLSSPDC